ncbi:glyoxylase-like metal-dependent hydrolase (beta-lactamase superfamily II) [Humibacillus xanthopallidus]|uniref:Glyoxylase-like metal-dependent hydrolase (Beta-lactamase superfamily II) n=1 Tax=Humibacillus xanthopallidus TaxID=412689 RepID=A0A543PT72_9MICO|nr:MBL fold metallo-hydrolase [Humibacillus xanthopallidus]TQN47269.1 glyoxylase-like metal-dependent hydrolase (beta-lactamase superfamily II) [Humibacillus xanthopallidus]
MDDHSGTTSHVDFGGRAVAAPFPERWIHGVPPRASRELREADPPLQVHRHDEHTYVLRQSQRLTFEGPFLYLLLGNERALLLDTGAVADPGRMPLRSTVDGLLDEWLAGHPRDRYPLVVAHTHGHGDHVDGDGQFANRPDTTVVGRDVDAVRKHFGFTDWPRQTVPFDLGGRVLEVTGSPGHHSAAITIRDPWTGCLLTGDTVYPGRLYVEDAAAFTQTLEALVEIADSRWVSAVMGCHVEMTRTPGRDYPLGTTYQPDEAPLPMTVGQLRSVRDAAREVEARPGAHVRDDVIIFNGPCRGAMVRQVARRAVAELVGRVRR